MNEQSLSQGSVEDGVVRLTIGDVPRRASDAGPVGVGGISGTAGAANLRAGDSVCAIRLEEEHYLGAVRPIGRTLFQAVHHQRRWVALLMWGNG